MASRRDYGNVRRQAIYIANTASDPGEAMDACFGHFLSTTISPRDFLVLVAAVEDVTGWKVGKCGGPAHTNGPSASSP
jgi:hypothetical protein